MLRRVGETVDSKDAVVKIKDASFPTPFVSALEYNSPVQLEYCAYGNAGSGIYPDLCLCG